MEKFLNIKAISVEVPERFVEVFYRILLDFSDCRTEKLECCQDKCESNPLKLYNLFQCAVGARETGNYKLSELIINFIDKALKNKTVPLTVNNANDDGLITGLVSENIYPNFDVNVDEGMLYATGNNTRAFKLLGEQKEILLIDRKYERKV